MDDKILQIRIEERKLPKTKFGRWWENKISYPLYSLKLKFKAWFFGGVYNLMLALMSKEKRKEIKERDREVLLQIVNESSDDRLTEYIRESLKENYNVKEDDITTEAVKKAITDMKSEI